MAKILEVKYENLADARVCEVAYESQADLCWHEVSYATQATGDALWFFVNYENQASLPLSACPSVRQPACSACATLKILRSAWLSRLTLKILKLAWFS